ncbi:hypothetical protein V5O48_007300 [Marasmius crinis-equi]|uniref:Uncharacterized protein n=1 Tax=Marasmius crinis-equi TaxID=585013 RepID=A0ABR3FH40_9AGAR
MSPQSAADLKEESNHFEEGSSKQPPPALVDMLPNHYPYNPRMYEASTSGPTQLESNVKYLSSPGVEELGEARHLFQEALDARELANRTWLLNSDRSAFREQSFLWTSEKAVSLNREIAAYKGTMMGTIWSFIGVNPFKERIKRLEDELRGLRDYFLDGSRPGSWDRRASVSYDERRGDNFMNSRVARTSRDVYNYHGTTYNTYNVVLLVSRGPTNFTPVLSSSTAITDTDILARRYLPD